MRGMTLKTNISTTPTPCSTIALCLGVERPRFVKKMFFFALGEMASRYLMARATVARAISRAPVSSACFSLPRQAAGAAPAGMTGRLGLHWLGICDLRAPRHGVLRTQLARRCMSGTAGGGEGVASAPTGMPTDKFFDVSAANFSQLVNERCERLFMQSFGALECTASESIG